MAIASMVVNFNAASVADSKAVVASLAASIADSKAVVADNKVNSAIGSEPSVGEYIITDMKRDASGSIVIEYNDSAIT